MKNKIALLCLLCIILLCAFGNQSKEKLRFHKIEFTASSVELVQWNISDTLNNAFVKETIDHLGRTRELRFYNCNHQLDWAGSGFYGGPIIKYDYQENQIIETFFNTETEIANDFRTSEVPYKFVYHLNDEKEILRTEMKYVIEFEWTKESLENTIKHLDFYKQFDYDGTNLKTVFGYTYATAKLNGSMPVLK